LAIFAMKNGDRDWRDEIVWLDGLCAVARDSQLDLSGLLREAAELASDTKRMDRPSVRATLLARATKAEDNKQA
jgi:hypothetical protein